MKNSEKAKHCCSNGDSGEGFIRAENAESGKYKTGRERKETKEDKEYSISTAIFLVKKRTGEQRISRATFLKTAKEAGIEPKQATQKGVYGKALTEQDIINIAKYVLLEKTRKQTENTNEPGEQTNTVNTTKNYVPTHSYSRGNGQISKERIIYFQEECIYLPRETTPSNKELSDVILALQKNYQQKNQMREIYTLPGKINPCLTYSFNEACKLFLFEQNPRLILRLVQKGILKDHSDTYTTNIANTPQDLDAQEPEMKHAEEIQLRGDSLLLLSNLITGSIGIDKAYKRYYHKIQ